MFDLYYSAVEFLKLLVIFFNTMAWTIIPIKSCSYITVSTVTTLTQEAVRQTKKCVICSPFHKEKCVVVDMVKLSVRTR